jgi:predicted DsbA family dithiol-disulfide isomerase
MRIEIWSDVVCPWCYIGKRRFEQALAEFPGRDEVEVVYRSFELDPRAPEDGEESVVEALGRKFGGGPSNGREMVDRVTQVAAESGLRFDYADAPHARTLDAHRLLHLALAEGGPALQVTLKEALLQAYFTEARSMGDHRVLRDVARASGLDPARVDEVLSSEEYAADVAEDLEQARDYGITGVPFFVVDRSLGISGAQPVEVFAQALEQASAAKRPALRVLAGGAVDAADAVDAEDRDGDACGPDGCEV